MKREQRVVQGTRESVVLFTGLGWAVEWPQRKPERGFQPNSWNPVTLAREGMIRNLLQLRYLLRSCAKHDGGVFCGALITR